MSHIGHSKIRKFNVHIQLKRLHRRLYRREMSGINPIIGLTLSELAHLVIKYFSVIQASEGRVLFAPKQQSLKSKVLTIGCLCWDYVIVSFDWLLDFGN